MRTALSLISQTLEEDDRQSEHDHEDREDDKYGDETKVTWARVLGRTGMQIDASVFESVAFRPGLPIGEFYEFRIATLKPNAKWSDGGVCANSWQRHGRLVAVFTGIILYAISVAIEEVTIDIASLSSIETAHVLSRHDHSLRYGTFLSYPIPKPRFISCFS